MLQVGDDFYEDILISIPQAFPDGDEDEAEIIARRDSDWEARAEHIMNHVAWRRSALEFLPWLLAGGQDPSQHAGVLEAVEYNEAKFAWALKNLRVIAENAQLFDEALKQLTAPGDNGWPDPPEGAPESHRWWWPEGVTPADIVARFEEEGFNEQGADDEFDI